jgi:chloramphenicol O-acetyltransferase type A
LIEAKGWPEECMRYIDLQTWPRRKHFEVYNAFDYPHINLCANVEITALHAFVKQRALSLNITLVYLFARVANAIPEFRYRIREGQVVEHEVVHPSSTIMTEGDLFSFCTIPYVEGYATFAERAERIIARLSEHPKLEDEPGQDDLLFMTGIPWVSFTSLQHPIHMHPVDSVPRISWGKFFPERTALKMPLSVQVHHALMDGVHLGRYYMQVQDYLDRPERLLP